ncbi:hypothetical protein MTR67_011061 [Solanum verrucosum]|uniref:Uncharacterized protein n=1 Tax=Solanum verrucosum TaxID=315347 RepID=A0AAF0TFT2_SOLVR|nr:hypothetical protein MTR67_011061 [Solanum verrucosum]
MKLLGWMHSILRQKGNEPPNNTAIIVSGNSVTTHDKEVKSNGAEQLFDEIFPGFLAIGTLGNYETSNTDPPTPTFPMHVETEKELKFIINDELEKVNEEFAFEPSERTIDNMEECPLQKYLLGSSVESQEIIESEEKLKQQKGLLEELTFKKKNKDKKKKKDAAHFMKKILQNLQPKSKSSNVTASVSSKKKLPQVLKMFYRKVHPVNENNILEDNHEISNNINVSCKAANLTNSSPKKEVINREHWIKTDRDYLVLELELEL